jgi:cell division septation protein DedD
VTQQAQVGQVSGYKVQLAAVQDASAAEREWRRLQGLHPELLGNLTLFTETVEIEGRGTFHRIQAGPLPSRETAADLCDVLKGREQPCLVVSP